MFLYLSKRVPSIKNGYIIVGKHWTHDLCKETALYLFISPVCVCVYVCVCVCVCVLLSIQFVKRQITFYIISPVVMS